MTSQFKTTTQGSTIKVDLLEQPGNYDWPIQFKDPWLIDYPDPNYNNKLRNQGMSAPLKNRSTPFYPDLGTSYDGDVYKGVFLLQGYPGWTPPYYSVGGPNGQTYGGFTWNFGKWLSNTDANGQPKAEFQDASSQNSAVVFKEADAIVTAQMKAPLASSASTVLGSNSQRKLARWRSNVISQLNGYSLFYESGNQIWNTKSTNMGATWMPEKLVSTNPGTHKSPSIALGGIVDGVPSNSSIVWHTNTSGSDQIWYQNSSALDWNPPYSPARLVGTLTAHPSVPPAPVVAYRGPDGYGLQAAYTTANGIEIMKSSNDGVTWIRDMYSDSLRGRYRPSLGSASSNAVYVSYDNGSRVFFDYYYRHCIGVPCSSYEGWWRVLSRRPEEVVPGSISNRSGFRGNSQVVPLASIGLGGAGVVWEMTEGEEARTDEPVEEQMEAEEGGGDMIPFFTYSVRFQSKWIGSSWGSATKFAGNNYRSPTISHLSNGRMLWAWTNGQSIIRSQSTDYGLTWSAPAALHEGVDPQAIIGAENPTQAVPYVYRCRLGPIYQLAFPQVGGQEEETEGVTREMIVADETSDGSLSIEMSPLWTKASAGTTQLIPFAVAEDSAFILSVDNVEQYLGTASHAVPEDADSICLRIRMSSKEASSIAIRNTSLRVRVHYTINNTTTRTLAQWRFVSDHSLNKTFRLPARGLRGKQVKVFVSVLGLNRQNSMLRASTASVYRSRPGSSPANKIAAEGTQGIPSEYTLGQNYPNPFNPSTTIKYDLPENSNVSLVVYDVLGRKVTELVNGTKEAGYHSAIWSASEVASGVYFARFTATDANGNMKLSKVSKLLLAK